jgi:hypothetical protein
MLRFYQLTSNLGYFITNNVTTNDTIIRSILQALLPDIKDLNNRRIRYFIYIINLVAKAFLFGNNIDSLELGKDLLKAEIKKFLEVRQD